MRSACAITLAVVTPTRRPVKSPGPVPDRDRGELVELDRRTRGAGTRSRARAARRDGARRRAAPRRAPRRRRRTRPTPARSPCRARGAARQPSRPRRRGRERVAAVAPVTPAASTDTTRSSSSAPGSSSTRSRSARQRRADAVAPLDDGHRVAHRRARRSRGRGAPAGDRGGTRRRARAAAGASYSRTTVNVGLTTGSVMPSADRDALGEHGLAGAELAVEHDDVAGAQQRAEPLPERVRLVAHRASSPRNVVMTTPTRARARA